MKTQLLQDIDDSGAMPPGDARAAAPSARRPRPAVWRWAHDNPTQAPLPSSDSPPPQAQASAGHEPDWLADLMRQDAEQAAARHRAGAWRRRLLGWSMAGAVLALAAAGGWWVLEERRVDGALVVVAETSPGQAALSQPLAARPLAPPAAVSAPALTAAPLSSAAAPVTRSEETLPAAPAVRRDAVTPPSKAGKKGESRAAAGREPGAHRRREETLLQCRALGYDEGQCDRKGCAMTRFGLACRG